MWDRPPGLSRVFPQPLAGPRERFCTHETALIAFRGELRQYYSENEADHLGFVSRFDGGLLGACSGAPPQPRSEPGLAASSANGEVTGVLQRADSSRRAAVQVAMRFLPRPRCRGGRDWAGP